LPARANAPARGLSLREIGFAPEMTRAKAIMPRICFSWDSQKTTITRKREPPAMTAYLISLALAGLLAIALWEGFS
jgi:hypothetical protein